AVKCGQQRVCPIGDGPPVVPDLEAPHRRVAAGIGGGVGLPFRAADVERPRPVLAYLVDHVATAVDHRHRQWSFTRACRIKHGLYRNACIRQTDRQLLDHAANSIDTSPIRASASSRLVELPLMAMPPTTWPFNRMARPPCSVVS